jgi:hypothetical protein
MEGKRMDLVTHPGIPTIIERHFADAVKGAAFDVHKRWRYVFTFDDLHQEAWLIASARWQSWSDQVKAARVDCRIHLYRWVDSQLPALGFKRVTIAGKRKWRKVVGDTPESHVIEKYETPQQRIERWNPESDPLGLTLAPWEWPDPDAAESPVALMTDWPPMTKSQRIRFARMLIRHYPVLVAEFLSLSDQIRPIRLSEAQWAARQERARGLLRVKYASELATARYAIEHGTRPAKQAA